MRRISAIVLAALLGFTATASAAEVELPPPPIVTKEMPVAAAPVVEAPPVLPLVVGGLIVAGIIVCVIECGRGRAGAGGAVSN
jgi:hypothetical protein